MTVVSVVTGHLSEGSFVRNGAVQIPKLDAKPNPNPMPIHFGQVNSVWLGRRVVMTLDLRSIGREFESWPLRYRVQPWASFNTHVPLSPSSITWYHPMGGDALRLGR